MALLPTSADFSVPIFGDGTVLEVNDGAAAAFQYIATMTRVKPPKTSVPKVERKRLVNTQQKLFVAGLVPEIGDVTFGYEITATEFQRWSALLTNPPLIATVPTPVVPGSADPRTRAWRMTANNGFRFAFSGFLQDNDPDQLEDGAKIWTGTAVIVVQSLIAYSVVATWPPTS